MANRVVAATILAMMDGTFDLDTLDLRFFGVSSSYTFDAAHDFLNDVTNIITDVVAATGETVDAATGGGRLDCDNPTLTGVNGAVAGVYAYDHTGGSDPERRLIAWWDDASGLPTSTLSGGSVPLTINASGVLSITSA